MKKIIFFVMFLCITMFPSCISVCLGPYDNPNANNNVMDNIRGYKPKAFELVSETLQQKPDSIYLSGVEVYRNKKGDFLCALFPKTMIYSYEGQMYEFNYETLGYQNVKEKNKDWKKHVLAKSKIINYGDNVKISSFHFDLTGQASLFIGEGLSLNWQDYIIKKDLFAAPENNILFQEDISLKKK